MAGTVSRGPPPIDRGWAWMIAFGFFLQVFFMVGLAKSYGLILVALLQEFHVTTATASLPISIALLVYAFGAPTAIVVANHFTIQKVVIMGAIIGFAGMALSSLLFNMTYFVLTFGLFYGIGNSCFYGNGMILIGKYFRDRRSLANGLALSGASIGQFALPPLIEYLLENYQLCGTLLLVAACYLHGAITGCLFRPIEQYDSFIVDAKPASEEKTPMVKDSDAESLVEKSPTAYEEADVHVHADSNGKLIDKDLENGATKDHSAVDEEDNDEWMSHRRLMLGSQGSVFMVSKSLADLTNANGDSPSNSAVQKSKGSKCFFSKIIDFRLLRSYVTVLFTVSSFLCFFGYFNFILFLPSIVLEKGIEKYDKAFLISICGIGDLIARISIGFFADLNIIPRYKIKALTCLLCAMNILMFIFADSFIWLAVHCFLYGFLGGGYVCLVAVVLVDLVGLSAMGPNLAVILFIQGIGASAGNPFLGFLKDCTGSFVVITIVCSVTLGMGAVVLFFYPMARRLEDKRLKRFDQ